MTQIIMQLFNRYNIAYQQQRNLVHARIMISLFSSYVWNVICELHNIDCPHANLSFIIVSQIGKIWSRIRTHKSLNPALPRGSAIISCKYTAGFN